MRKPSRIDDHVRSRIHALEQPVGRLPIKCSWVIRCDMINNKQQRTQRHHGLRTSYGVAGLCFLAWMNEVPVFAQYVVDRRLTLGRQQIKLKRHVNQRRQPAIPLPNRYS